MTPTSTFEASTSLLAQLINPAGRTIVLACAAGLALAAFRVKTTSLRLFTWTAVLYGAVAMPFLGRILPPLPVPSPQFLRTETKQQAAQPVFYKDPSSHGLAIPPGAPRTRAAFAASGEAVRPSRRRYSIPWSTLATGIYLAIAFLFLARFLVGFLYGRRLVQAAQPIDDPVVARRVAASASILGLSFVPHFAQSELTAVPVTLGAMRSTILLPAGWREWDDGKLDAVIAHEMSHVARRDALTQRLSLLHRAIFWFSPLAWWLDRQLADLAEQASDEATLSCGVDRKDYARILLSFFEALHAAPGRVRWQGVAMAKAGQAEQRVERILAWRGYPMRLKKSIAAVVFTLTLPVIYVTASAKPLSYVVEPQHPPITQDQASQPAPAAPSEETPAPSEFAGTIHGGVRTVPAGAPVAPVPSIAGTAVVAPANPKAAIAPVAAVPANWLAQRKSSKDSSGGYSYAYGDDDEQRFVIVTGKTDSVTMSGSSEDARHAEKLRKQIPGDFIWFERDEKPYIIRDQATIDRAKKLWAPQEELGKQQEELGKQQEALGKQQEELGSKMQQIHVKVPDMTAELDKLKAELKQLNSNATMEQVGRIQSEIGELQSKIGDIQSQAGDQQSKLGEQMGALGEKQGKLGEKQGELGEKQAELAHEATREMKTLLDEAITKGTAQPER
jgi:beta-lactamase regulating signal transducer with metallopeptidase domain